MQIILCQTIKSGVVGVAYQAPLCADNSMLNDYKSTHENRISGIREDRFSYDENHSATLCSTTYITVQFLLFSHPPRRVRLGP